MNKTSNCCQLFLLWKHILGFPSIRELLPGTTWIQPTKQILQSWTDTVATSCCIFSHWDTAERLQMRLGALWFQRAAEEDGENEKKLSLESSKSDLCVFEHMGWVSLWITELIIDQFPLCLGWKCDEWAFVIGYFNKWRQTVLSFSFIHTPQKHAVIVIFCQMLEYTHTHTPLMSVRHSLAGLFNLGLADYSNYVKEKILLSTLPFSVLQDWISAGWRMIACDFLRCYSTVNLARQENMLRCTTWTLLFLSQF